MVHRPHFNKLQILPDTESTKSKNANDISDRDPKKLEAARLFENQFVRQMIREMRKTVPQNENGQGLIPESMGSKIFKDQLDDKYADQWVDHGGIGLADIIYDQLEAKEVRDKMGLSKKNNIFLNQKIPQSANQAPKPNDNSPGPFDVISKSQKDLFLLKASGDSLHIKSKEPKPVDASRRNQRDE
jgi:Rod binding domain-containing protein